MSGFFSINDIRVVISIDFGTTFSGFTYANVFDNEKNVQNDDMNFDYYTYNLWDGTAYGKFKTNTVLRYDNEFKEVLAWGALGLAKNPGWRRGKNTSNPVELFKLSLGNLAEDLKPELPPGLHLQKEQRHIRAITDYLQKIDINFSENIRLILTVPAEYSYQAKKVMRECAFEAKLITKIDSDRLQFTTEPEAAAIYCITKRSLRDNFLNDSETTFLIVDCGGGTVDLTTRKLLSNCELGEVTERAGDFCGSTFVDKEFLKFLGKIVGESAIKLLREKHYGEMQYMVQEFCNNIKIPYTGDDNFTYDFDLDRICQVLKQYVIGEAKTSLEEKEWIIEIDNKDVKEMFDPIVERIIRLIQVQLENSRTCSALFMVGGFSESKYLQNRVKNEFKDKVAHILIPPEPTAAIVRGAVIYGLRMNPSFCNIQDPSIKPIIKNRVLKYTYGVEVGIISRFSTLAKRGTTTEVNQKFDGTFIPLFPYQSAIKFKIYITQKHEVERCHEEGVEFLGELLVDLPDIDLGLNRKVKFSLCFGEEEIKASAINSVNGQNYHTVFNLDTES
ncbi:25251_t:CDS:10 [Racocetra persica]|uniref:25251_t:CDS:1 n=1 Tax=Racocetra persica TaxID=160502 RepID=A0ACA9KJ73_9GLOM|nr:25251_t:CDS:10 [Racocetra persica]